ncbi:hypothetical protein [Wohlfahrtiimonas chitiniclastica]|uniref:hypothetical protein n=1 Tax=Wohlfahrtiimonas chitiniclastica TaxID=400946 RepID=UPI001BCCB861|nr:hypothetical protein [Wohlfahrtiimonas chitiniclastica]MBS7837203.1 hypothetical protein [Wohlfahrtiimonas chitiniclastica]
MIKKNSSNLKRKHHFVWAHYMRKWSYNRNEVFYTTQKDKHIIRTVGVGGISCDKGFYDIPLITDLHRECILDLCISPSTNTNLRSLHNNFLNKIVYMQKILQG